MINTWAQGLSPSTKVQNKHKIGMFSKKHYYKIIIKYKISNISYKKKFSLPLQQVRFRKVLLVPSLGGLSDRVIKYPPLILSPNFMYCFVTTLLYFTFSEEQKQLRAVTATG